MAQVRVNPFKVLAACAAQWNSYRILLGPAATRVLGQRLAELRTAGGDRDAAADRAARTLLDALPPDAAAALREDAPRPGSRDRPRQCCTRGTACRTCA